MTAQRLTPERLAYLSALWPNDKTIQELLGHIAALESEIEKLAGRVNAARAALEMEATS